jgi:hypothetical protein
MKSHGPIVAAAIRQREIKRHSVTRNFCSWLIIGCVFNVCLYASVAPAEIGRVATIAVLITVLAAFGVRFQTREIRRLRDDHRLVPVMRGGVFFQPEIGLPPGYRLPSVALAPPSKPPMAALPPTVVETVLMSRGGITVLPLDRPSARCAHPGAVPVDQPPAIGGERVAWLCPNPKCDAQLPADWPA